MPDDKCRYCRVFLGIEVVVVELKNKQQWPRRGLFSTLICVLRCSLTIFLMSSNKKIRLSQVTITSIMLLCWKNVGTYYRLMDSKAVNVE